MTSNPKTPAASSSKSNYNSPSMSNPEADELWAEATERNRLAARLLVKDLSRQTRQNLGPTLARGYRAYDIDGGAIVSMGRIQSAFARPGGTQIKGDPNLWILTDEGKRLGFKRIGKRFTWPSLQRKHGSNIFIQNGQVLYKYQGRLVAVYTIRRSVKLPQKIDLEGAADRAFRQAGSANLTTTDNEQIKIIIK